jgi:hypothetical protein
VRTSIVLAAAALLAAAPAAADCPRDALYPADLPWIACPRLVMPAPCLWCVPDDVRLDLYYDDADPAALVDAVAAGLGSSWTVTVHTKDTLAAVAPKRRFYIKVTAEKRSTLMFLESGPRP